MSSEIFNALKGFTVKQGGVKEAKVTEEASLENDLGIYGDDAMEFIEAFGKAFNVDISRFMAEEYFSPEGDVILPSIMRFLTGKKKTKQKDLIVKHLQKAIIAGRLDEEVINA